MARREKGGAKVYRSKFRRLLELDQQIRAGSYPNAFSFARDWEMSRRTVVRDIEFLRDSLRAPIEYDPREAGYYYSDPSWTFQQIELTEGELLLLLVAKRMADQYRGTPLAETLESLCEKIRTILPDKVSVDPAYLKTQVSFHGQPSRPVSEDIWLPLFRALRENRVVRFWYRAVHWRKGHTRDVEPVHLACLADEWYLVAYDRAMEDLRHFAVSRIQSIDEVLAEVFEPREFNPDEYFANRFGRFVGEPGEVYDIEIRFSKDAAPWVLERTWHPKQETKKHRDGTLTLAFPAPSLYEVRRWVMQWGSDAEVIKPEELRQELAVEAKELTRMYGK